MVDIELAWTGPFSLGLPPVAAAGVYAFAIEDDHGTLRLARIGATNNFLQRMAQYCKRGPFGRDTDLHVFFATVPVDMRDRVTPLLHGRFMDDLQSLEYRLEYKLFEGIKARNAGRIPAGNATSGSRTLAGMHRTYLSELRLKESPLSIVEMPLADPSARTALLRESKRTTA